MSSPSWADLHRLAASLSEIGEVLSSTAARLGHGASGLGSSWSGDGYNTFLANSEQSAAALRELAHSAEVLSTVLSLLQGSVRFTQERYEALVQIARARGLLIDDSGGVSLSLVGFAAIPGSAADPLTAENTTLRSEIDSCLNDLNTARTQTRAAIGQISGALAHVGALSAPTAPTLAPVGGFGVGMLAGGVWAANRDDSRSGDAAESSGRRALGDPLSDAQQR